MTIPPSAPPVLAEEPATTAHPLFGIDAYVRWGDAPCSCTEESRCELHALRAEVVDLRAQARQGREDAAPDWWCQCGGRAYRATALGWQCTFCRAIQPKPPLAATPSPSPEGASR